jgi:hypothetical protein
MVKKVVAIWFLLSFPPGSAAAALIDFEDVGDAGTIQPTITSQGYLFSPASGEPFNGLVVLLDGGDCFPACAANGTQTLAAGGVESHPGTFHPVTMTQLLGGSFTLLGFDYAEFVEGGNDANATSLHLVGNLLGGGTVQQDLALDGINDGPGGGADFESAVLFGFWSSSVLTSLQFWGFDGRDVASGFQLDNILVSADVPEPAALLLLGLGLAAYRRGRRSRGRA